MKDLGGLDQAARLALADTLITRLDGAPFGTVPKRELDVAIFTGLIAAGYVSDTDPVFVTAKRLEITPGRVKSLLYSYRMSQDSGPGFERMLAAVRIVSVERGGDAVLNVEDAYWRDALIARLKEVGVFTDGAHNSERVVLEADQFLAAFDDAFGTDGTDAKARIDELLAEDDRDGQVAFVRGIALKALGEMALAAVKALIA
ncbi:hypothetical protein RN607_09635 [Demequina capsici]|uniref:Uncharacterized protein n=1 Tax=Demequina capsici TaxID=3075620 RepID=A0AA96J5Y8_9MICO|nr:MULTISPECIES: hypothetical protein [unclassified Demequina]WNM23622.1 hypothetical protein RN606_09635 [Demequina sp. OYTSA14]WNM26460.1 hypothetical protein RN607_09635 [Demequina sp. PMTSA13]